LGCRGFKVEGRRPFNLIEAYLVDMKNLRLLCVGDAFIARLSRLYGTEIEYKDGLGVTNP
jgi:hypothetical protein